jgi:hypothetical protein
VSCRITCVEEVGVLQDSKRQAPRNSAELSAYKNGNQVLDETKGSAPMERKWKKLLGVAVDFVIVW